MVVVVVVVVVIAAACDDDDLLRFNHNPHAQKIRSADTDADFLERELARLGPTSSIHKEKAEVPLLKARVLACNKNLEIKESVAARAREREEAELELIKA